MAERGVAALPEPAAGPLNDLGDTVDLSLRKTLVELPTLFS
ncbi:MAG: hypothetical protein ACYCW6_22020 [Candidatus Xenobia bacterium]